MKKKNNRHKEITKFHYVKNEKSTGQKSLQTKTKDKEPTRQNIFNDTKQLISLLKKEAQANGLSQVQKGGVQRMWALSVPQGLPEAPRGGQVGGAGSSSGFIMSQKTSFYIPQSPFSEFYETPLDTY